MKIRRVLEYEIKKNNKKQQKKMFFKTNLNLIRLTRRLIKLLTCWFIGSQIANLLARTLVILYIYKKLFHDGVLSLGTVNLR